MNICELVMGTFYFEILYQYCCGSISKRPKNLTSVNKCIECIDDFRECSFVPCLSRHDQDDLDNPKNDHHHNMNDVNWNSGRPDTIPQKDSLHKIKRKKATKIKIKIQ